MCWGSAQPKMASPVRSKELLSIRNNRHPACFVEKLVGNLSVLVTIRSCGMVPVLPWGSAQDRLDMTPWWTALSMACMQINDICTTCVLISGQCSCWCGSSCLRPKRCYLACSQGADAVRETGFVHHVIATLMLLSTCSQMHIGYTEHTST